MVISHWKNPPYATISENGLMYWNKQINKQFSGFCHETALSISA